MFEKLLDIIANESHDKLTNIIIKLLNSVIQLTLSILIIVYAIQSFLLFPPAHTIVKNDFYIKYIKQYMDITTKIAHIGHELCWALPLIGILLIIISYCLREIFFNFFEEEFEVNFFIGDFLLYTSLGLTFWSAIFWVIFWIVDDYLKYYLLLIYVVAILPFGLYLLLEQMSKQMPKLLKFLDKHFF